MLHYPTCCPQPLPPLLCPPPSPPVTTECTLNQGCFSSRQTKCALSVWLFFMGEEELLSCISHRKLHSEVCFSFWVGGYFALKRYFDWGEVVSFSSTGLSSSSLFLTLHSETHLWREAFSSPLSEQECGEADGVRHVYRKYELILGSVGGTV